MAKTIHQQLKDANIQTSGHCSDLYCPVTEVTTRIISDYRYKGSVTKFTNQIDKKQWYDIPFANDDYYKTKGIKNGN